MRLIVLVVILAVAFGKFERGRLKNYAPNHQDFDLRPPTCNIPNLFPNSIVAEGMCPFTWASGLRTPRGVDVASNGDVIVLERGSNSLTVLWDANNDGRSGAGERATLFSGLQLNHGVWIEERTGHLYATSATAVYRWNYRAGQRTNLGQPVTLINGIPGGGHATRTVAFTHANANVIYVSVGSLGNVDRDSVRSRVVRFNLVGQTFPIPWARGEIFADGLRNEIALRFDSQDRGWGVENGCDNLFRSDLGGSIVRDNPSEEMNLFDVNQPGLHYGYPWCFTEYEIPRFGMGPGTQWVHPDFMGKGGYSDAWCRNPNNNVPPAFNFGAHRAPIDLVFDPRPSRFPEVEEEAFGSFRGSWNRNPAGGYEVHRIYLVPRADNGTANKAHMGPIKLDVDIQSEPIFKFRGPGETGTGWIRPTGLGLIGCSVYSRDPDALCPLLAADNQGVLIGMAFNHRLEINTTADDYIPTDDELQLVHEFAQVKSETMS